MPSDENSAVLCVVVVRFEQYGVGVLIFQCSRNEGSPNEGAAAYRSPSPFVLSILSKEFSFWLSSYAVLFTKTLVTFAKGLPFFNTFSPTCSSLGVLFGSVFNTITFSLISLGGHCVKCSVAIIKHRFVPPAVIISHVGSSYVFHHPPSHHHTIRLTITSPTFAEITLLR